MKISWPLFLGIILSLILLTFIREIFVLVVFVLPLVFLYANKFRVSKYVLFLSLVSFGSFLIGFLTGTTTFANGIYSLAYGLTFLMMLNFLDSITRNNFFYQPRTVQLVFYFFFITLAISNLIGIFEVTFNPFNHFPWEDAFIGIYGRHGIGHHGLAIINGLVSFFFLGKLIHEKQQKLHNFFFFSFFLFSHLLAFYGLGTVLLVLAMGIFFIFKVRSAKSIIAVFVIIITVSFGFYKVFGQVASYMFENLNYVSNLIAYVDGQETYVPRKALIYFNYIEVVCEKPSIIYSGMGPGAFNSRAAFLLNVDSDNFLTALFGKQMPQYHSQYVQPLWDKSQLSVFSFNDGTRNQPFSSMLSILAEYGIVFSFFLWIYFYKISRSIWQKSYQRNVRFFLKVSFYFIFLNLIFDNFFEFSEFYVYFFLIFLTIVGFERVSTNSIETVHD